MSDCRKNENKNNHIDNNKNTSNIGNKSLILIFLLIIICSVGFSRLNAIPQEDYTGSVFCGNCHINQYDEWNQSAHSQAYSSQIFQANWQKYSNSDVCLSCHTTGYDPSSGNFQFENVGCESCHHPVGEETMKTSSTICSSCHSVIHFPTHPDSIEIEHSHVGLDCASCHDSMSLEIRTEDPNDLCKDCHGLDAIEPVAENHGLGYECLDCHTITSLVDFEDEKPETTGHTFPEGFNPDCSSCHDISLDAHNVWGTTTDNCIICHDSASIPMLHLLNDTDVAISESSILCAQCHNDVYSEWLLGIHINNHEEKTCIDCHDPHSPYIIINKTLPPVSTIAGVNEIPDPIVPPAFFFIAFIGALCAAFYAFVVRRT